MMTAAKERCFRQNRLAKISAAGFVGPYGIEFSETPGFWFVMIDGRSYPIGHDGTTDAEMARKANEWVAKYAT